MKEYLHDWLFVMEIHRKPMDFSDEGAVMREFDIFTVNPNSKRSN